VAGIEQVSRYAIGIHFLQTASGIPATFDAAITDGVALVHPVELLLGIVVLRDAELKKLFVLGDEVINVGAISRFKIVAITLGLAAGMPVGRDQ
jgi:hypothetical protein